MASIELRLLGPVQLRVDGVDCPMPPRARAVLAYLATHRDAAVPVDRILAELWGPDAGDGARHSLQTYISMLRRLLSPGGAAWSISFGAGGYRLHLDDASLDVSRFEQAAVRAIDHGDLAAASEALDRWRAEPFGELTDQAWAVPVAASLQQLRRRVELVRLDALLDTGQDEHALDELDRLVSSTPLDERLWARRMTALYRTGRQSEALDTYRQLQQTLREELGVDPSAELADLQRRILRQDPTLTAAKAPPHRVPASITSFVGRASELEHLRSSVGRHRLVTISGPGGVGKTRTAIELAQAWRGGWCDGVFFIDLAPLSDAEQVIAEIAAQLSVDVPGDGSLETLSAHTRPLSCLLVLDNAEHLRTEVAAIVARLLQDAEALRIVVTSRIALGRTGEVVWRLSPLELPRADDDVAHLADRDAVRLFVERAGDVRPGFRPGSLDLASVAHICIRLDGLPLAIELAASRLRSLSVSEIEARLDRDLSVLRSSDPTAAERRRTLAAVLRWSTDLLPPDTRRVFARLAVIPGGFDQAAAAAVCRLESGAIADQLEVLVDHSLLTVGTSGTRSRYRMLEVVRDHAQELLGDLGEEDETLQALLDHTVELSRRAIGGLTGPDERSWVERLSADRAVLRAGLAAGLTQDPAAGLRLAKHLVRFWWANAGDAEVLGRHERPTLDEGIEWLERFLAVAEVDVRTRGAAETALGWFLALTGRHDRARALLFSVRDQMAAAGEVRLAGWAGLYAATASWEEAPAEVIAGYVTACVRFEAVGDREGQMLAAMLEYTYTQACLGAVAAREPLARFLAFTEGEVSPTVQVYRSGVVATQHLVAVRPDAARGALLAAMDANRDSSDPATTSLLLWLGGWYAAVAGEAEIAVLAVATGDHLEARHGLVMPPRLLLRTEALAAPGVVSASEVAPAATDPAAPRAVAEVMARVRALIV